MGPGLEGLGGLLLLRPRELRLGVLVLRHEDRTRRGLRVVEGVERKPGAECRAVLGPEAPFEELRVSFVPLRLRVEPEPERVRVIEALLAAQSVRRVGLDPVLAREAVQACLAPVPPARLVAAPGSRDGNKREQDLLKRRAAALNTLPNGKVLQ